MSPAVSTYSSTLPIVSVTRAGSLSFPDSLPSAMASRIAPSISRCEVTPTFLRNLRTLMLKTSSSIFSLSPRGSCVSGRPRHGQIDQQILRLHPQHVAGRRRQPQIDRPSDDLRPPHRGTAALEPKQLGRAS